MRWNEWGRKAGMLETVDLTQTLDPEDYHVQLTELQVRLAQLGFQVYKQQRPVILAFEGWDAAGKGGAIKRLTERLDPRGYHAWPISAPTDEEKRHHYLWRFWTRLPE